jgi:hypothetical protein
VTGPTIEITADLTELRQISAALRGHADGKRLKAELVAMFRTTVEPGVTAVRTRIQDMPHHGLDQPTPGLRETVARSVKVSVRLSGTSAGVSVRIPQTPRLRKFRNAAKALNFNGGRWRHPVYGRGQVTQTSGIGGYFEPTLAKDKPVYVAGCEEVVRHMFRRIVLRIP